MILRSPARRDSVQGRSFWSVSGGLAWVISLVVGRAGGQRGSLLGRSAFGRIRATAPGTYFDGRGRPPALVDRLVHYAWAVGVRPIRCRVR